MFTNVTRFILEHETKYQVKRRLSGQLFLQMTNRIKNVRPVLFLYSTKHKLFQYCNITATLGQQLDITYHIHLQKILNIRLLNGVIPIKKLYALYCVTPLSARVALYRCRIVRGNGDPPAYTSMSLAINTDSSMSRRRGRPCSIYLVDVNQKIFGFGPLGSCSLYLGQEMWLPLTRRFAITNPVYMTLESEKKRS